MVMFLKRYDHSPFKRERERESIIFKDFSLNAYLIELIRLVWCERSLNPYLTNGFSHHYRLGESTFIFRGVRSDF